MIKTKIPKEHKLKKNEIYYVSDENIFFIGKYLLDNKKSDEKYLRGKFTFISNIDSESYYRIGKTLCFYNFNKLRNYRIASYKERKWLEFCIKENSFISEKKFNTIFRKDLINKLLYENN